MNGDITKAFLLAAGEGTRLRPLTNHTPKCLAPIGGRPLLGIWLEFCERLGVREALVNTHHLAPQVRNWAAAQKTSLKIHLSHEEALLGSAGTIAANRDFVGDASNFYIFYADNLVSTDLTSLQKLHHHNPAVLTLGLFETPHPESCGVVTLGPGGVIASFEEKPAAPKSDLAFAGLLIASSAVFDWLPSPGSVADLGKDVLPELTGKMWGEKLEGFLLDIGTPENYARAQREWPAHSGAMEHYV